MTRIGLAVLVVVVLAAGRATALPMVCGNLGNQCCAAGVLPDDVPCDPGLLCSAGDLCLGVDGHVCGHDRDCVSGFCQFPAGSSAPPGICVTRKGAPAASTHTTMLMGAGLLLLGLWSVRRLARRR